MTTAAAPDPDARSLRQAGYLLGISLGGFFDGILLHQVLQWHHLLSNVQGVQDLRTQVLADGLFHVLMYLLAAAALFLLWRSRGGHARAGAGALLWGSALIGFGAWHLADNVLFHWILGLHRIRVGVPDPLFWDLLWFFVFGVVPAAIGWKVRRRGSGGGGGRAAAAALAVGALAAGTVALRPADNPDELLVLFRPDVRAPQAFNALAGVDARVLWVDGSGGMWAVKLPRPEQARRLYAAGALLVSNAPVGLGCFSWSRSGR